MWKWCADMREEWVAHWKYLKVSLSCTCWGQNVWVLSEYYFIKSNKSPNKALVAVFVPSASSKNIYEGRILQMSNCVHAQVILIGLKPMLYLWRILNKGHTYQHRTPCLLLNLLTELRTENTPVFSSGRQMLKTTHTGSYQGKIVRFSIMYVGKSMFWTRLYRIFAFLYQ